MLAAILLSGCSDHQQASGGTGDGTTTAGSGSPRGAANVKILLAGSEHNTGPWSERISVKRGKEGVPNQFYVCATRSSAPPAGPCQAAPGSVLPDNTILHLEQHPPGPGLVSADSPGWGLIGSSDQADLKIVLSDFVSASKPGQVTYRVTLRTLGGEKLAASNTIRVDFHS